MRLVSELKTQGVTVIVVEHIVKAVLNLCDWVIVLNAGQKIAEGPPAAISSNPAVITAYLGPRYATG
jgi:branched-chain amino acid transport system ATP-binding protein